MNRPRLRPTAAMASPPPIPRETYRVEMAATRELIGALKNAENVNDAVKRGIPIHEAVTTITERLIQSVSALEDKVAAQEMNVAQMTPLGNRRGKPLAESKCIGNLKTLGSDKAEFKIWNDKFINAVAQTLGTPWRKYMRNLNRQLDADRKVLAESELNSIEGADEIGNGNEASEGLYYVLVEKTEGDAALRVNSGEPGQGIEAYMRVYLWFAGTTGLALTEKNKDTHAPEPSKARVRNSRCPGQVV